MPTNICRVFVGDPETTVTVKRQKTIGGRIDTMAQVVRVPVVPKSAILDSQTITISRRLHLKIYEGSSQALRASARLELRTPSSSGLWTPGRTRSSESRTVSGCQRQLSRKTQLKIRDFKQAHEPNLDYRPAK